MPVIARRFVTLPAALVLFVSACGDSYEPSEPGQFTATISGDVERELAGQAAFRHDLLSSGVGNAFLLTQVDGADRVVHSVSLYRWSDAPITPGTYRIILGDEPDATDEDFSGAVVLDGTGTAGPYSCLAERGSVRIAHASPQRIEGSFELSGHCGLPAAERLIIPFDAEGSFTAVPGAFGPPETAPGAH